MAQDLKGLLNRLNEENEVSGVTKQSMGITRSEDWEKVPPGMKQIFKQYKDAGGECDNIFEFMRDIAGFLDFKGLTGRHIAEWDKKKGPESNSKEKS